MTTITPGSGNQGPPRTPLRSGPGVPGTLTAVPHADQSQTTQKGASVTYPGPPRPEHVPATPLAELAGQLGVAAPETEAGVTGITHDSRAVRPGDLYAALPGARLHGADFDLSPSGTLRVLL
ncbi:Mur ligase domain-containing protein, partial [Streptomyces sp. ECR3]|uniref:Mur ligase domain-containing protein n=1 Tax=Streptomyces sp. ECR3 TaxID=3400630 RepID=UPI003F1D8B14